MKAMIPTSSIKSLAPELATKFVDRIPDEAITDATVQTFIKWVSGSAIAVTITCAVKDVAYKALDTYADIKAMEQGYNRTTDSEGTEVTNGLAA